MARRLVFLVNNEIGEYEVEFDWYPGFSLKQKQKSIESLHKNINNKFGNIKVLEISTKSNKELGVKLSAFNLKDNNGISVEELYQKSKVFNNGLKVGDIEYENIYSLRQKIKSTKSMIIFFHFRGVEYPIDPPTVFYDWLYINVLLMNKNLIEDIIRENYTAFTDIEFNQNRQVNCQARALSVFIYMYKNKKISKLNSFSEFSDYYSRYISKKIL